MEETANLHLQTMQHFNERQRRIYAGSIAKQYGWGGIARMYTETGMDSHTIMRGIRESLKKPLLYRIREVGGGRKKATEKTPHLMDAIKLEANAKTDKRTIVKWTSHSMEHITNAIKTRGFSVSFMTAYRILKEKGYALRANKKDLEGGADHPDRDTQFNHINRRKRNRKTLHWEIR